MEKILTANANQISVLYAQQDGWVTQKAQEEIIRTGVTVDVSPNPDCQHAFALNNDKTQKMIANWCATKAYNYFCAVSTNLR